MIINNVVSGTIFVSSGVYNNTAVVVNNISVVINASDSTQVPTLSLLEPDNNTFIYLFLAIFCFNIYRVARLVVGSGGSATLNNFNVLTFGDVVLFSTTDETSFLKLFNIAVNVS
jgi:hypothetical protein